MPSIDQYTLRRLLDKDLSLTQVSASTCVADLDYEVFGEVLTVKFQKRGTYIYKGVSVEEFVLFAGASSPGRFFNLYIRDRYPYEKVE